MDGYGLVLIVVGAVASLVIAALVFVIYKMLGLFKDHSRFVADNFKTVMDRAMCVSEDAMEVRRIEKSERMESPATEPVRYGQAGAQVPHRNGDIEAIFPDTVG